MPIIAGDTTLAARVPPGPRGNRVLGSVGDIYRDRLRFVLDTARIYGDVAQYRVAHMRMYQVNDRPFPELVQSVVEAGRMMMPESDIRLDVEDEFPPGPMGEAGVTSRASCGRRSPTPGATPTRAASG